MKAPLTDIQQARRNAWTAGLFACALFGAGAFVLGYESALVEESNHRASLIKRCEERFPDLGLASTIHTPDLGDVEICVTGSHRREHMQ